MGRGVFTSPWFGQEGRVDFPQPGRDPPRGVRGGWGALALDLREEALLDMDAQVRLPLALRGQNLAEGWEPGRGRVSGAASQGAG